MLWISCCSNYSFVKSAFKSLTMLTVEQFIEKGRRSEFFQSLSHPSVKCLQLKISHLYKINRQTKWQQTTDKINGNWLSEFPSIEVLSFCADLQDFFELKTIDFNDDVYIKSFRIVGLLLLHFKFTKWVRQVDRKLKYLKLISCKINLEPDIFAGLENLKSKKTWYIPIWIRSQTNSKY